MKHLKSKLMASAAMLMVATVMISSASFAWFTISTAPEVTGVSTKMAANGNLEIALADYTVSGTTATLKAPADSTTADTGKNTTWGNVIDISDWFNTENAKTTGGFTLKPVSLVTTATVTANSAKAAADQDAINVAANLGKMYVPEFGADGRIKELGAASAAYQALNGSTVTGAYTDGGLTVFSKTTGTGDAAVTNNYAFRVDYWMRTNTEGDVYLDTTGADRGSGEAGLGTWVKVKKSDGTYDTTATVPVSVAFQVTPYTATTTSGVTTVAADSTDPTAIVKYYDGAAATPAWDTAAIIDNAAANKLYLVSMYVYWDGGNMSNDDFTNAERTFDLNVQFKHTAKDGSASSASDLKDLGLDGTENKVHPTTVAPS